MSAGRIPSPTQYKFMNKDINKNIDALLQKRQTGLFGRIAEFG